MEKKTWGHEIWRRKYGAMKYSNNLDNCYKSPFKTGRIHVVDRVLYIYIYIIP